MSAEAQSGAPRAMGSMAQPDEPTCSSKRHRCQCRVPRWPPDRPWHIAGVVSRVPCSSRSAQAFGADRNTYLKTTHPRERTDTPGQLTDRSMRDIKTTNARPAVRPATAMPAQPRRQRRAQHDPEHLLDPVAIQLQELGYRNMASASAQVTWHWPAGSCSAIVLRHPTPLHGTKRGSDPLHFTVGRPRGPSSGRLQSASCSR